MKLVTTKKAADIGLFGIAAELEIVDKQVRSVLLRDESGREVRITKGEYYSSEISIQIPAPAETEKKFRLHGDVVGLPVDKQFATEGEARKAKSDLEIRVQDGGAVLDVEPVDVPVSDDVAPTLDEIPF